MPFRVPFPTLHGLQDAERNFDEITLRWPDTADTVLPSNPFDGQQLDYLADPASGVVWRLRYNAGSASAYKWEFVGGSSLMALVATLESRSATTYGALATAGPALTLPLAGDYDVEVGAGTSTGGAAEGSWMSYDIGGTAAVDADAALGQVVGPGFSTSVATMNRKTRLSAVTLTAKYRSSAVQATFWEKRFLRATPVRVG
jgi:hypothetical protein